MKVISHMTTATSIKVVKLHVKHGETIQIPFLDLIAVQMTDKVWIGAGRVWDIFASPKGGEHQWKSSSGMTNQRRSSL
jgi:hypothetical protein